MKTKTKAIIAAATLTIAAATATGVYANNSVDIRTTLMDKIYQSLPAETQDSYDFNNFSQQDYALQSVVVKNFVDDGLLTDPDKAYVSVNSLMQLPDPERVASLENVLGQSSYDVMREVTFYGLPQLKTEDASTAMMNSGKTIWTNFTEKVQEAYDNIFNK